MSRLRPPTGRPGQANADRPGPSPSARRGGPIGERELIALIALLMGLQAFGIDAMLPALGQIAEDLGAGGNRRQLVIGAYFLGSGLGALFPGAFADRFGRRKVVIAGLAAYLSLSLLCSVLRDFELMVAVRFIQGLACAGLSVVPAAIVRDRVGGDRMARMMSLIMMVFLLTPVLAPAIGQLIMVVAGWRAIFVAMAAMGLIVGLWAWLRLPETLDPAYRQRIDVGTVLANMARAVANRAALGYVLGSALVFGSLFGFLNSSQQLIAETFGAEDRFALIFGGAVLGMVLANFTNSRIVERFGARRVSHGALIGFIVFSVLLWWSASQPGPQPLAQFVVLMSLLMAMLGFIGANFSSIAMQPFLHIAGAASSAHASLRMSTGAVLGALIGQAYDGSARPLAISMLACGLFALAMVLYSEKGRLFARRTLPQP